MKKPNHPPFNEWLLAGELLTPEQNQSLQEHLHSCPECSQLQAAWTEVHFQFHTREQLAPAPGFTSRLQQRLLIQHARRQRRNSWVLFFGASLMALIILSVVAWQVTQIFNSPASLISGLVYLWTLSFAISEQLTNFLWGIVRFLPSITLIGLVLFVGVCSLMSVLWLVTYRQLISARRVVTW